MSPVPDCIEKDQNNTVLHLRHTRYEMLEIACSAKDFALLLIAHWKFSSQLRCAVQQNGGISRVLFHSTGLIAKTYKCSSQLRCTVQQNGDISRVFFYSTDLIAKTYASSAASH